MDEAVLFVGFVLELAGLLITARGLLTTWRTNTNRPFLPPRAHRGYEWLRVRVLRRPPRRHRGSATGSSGRSRSGYGIGVMPLLSAREGETIAERLDRIETNLQQVHSRSAANIKLMKEGERQRDRQDALLARRLTETERKVTAFAKELAVDGIRLAVLGLLFLATGLALQALAAWL